MYKVAEGHNFIGRGVRFAPGDEITGAAFASQEAFLRKVEAGHIIKVEAQKAASGGDAAAKKAREAELKAAKKKKADAQKEADEAQKELDKAKADLASAAEADKLSHNAKVEALTKTLKEKEDALSEAGAALLVLESE